MGGVFPQGEAGDDVVTGRLNTGFVLLTMIVLSTACAADVQLGVALEDSNRVEVSLWHAGQLAVGSILLYRSTSPLDGDIDTVASPVTVLRFPVGDADAVLVDSMFAHNVTYYYRAQVRRKLLGDVWSNVDSVHVPDVRIGRITGSSLLIDKLHYFLEVRDGGRMKKRYPVALGSKPRNRKLHMDRASTPEGIYRIHTEQPEATFYKAFDIDYPNEVDRARYRCARELGLLPRRDGDNPAIGGEIQIHGEGIGTNWTWGCIALRNSDIDELFEHDRVGKGMPVHIVGRELTRADIQSIEDYRTEPESKRMQRRLKSLGYYEGKPDGVIGAGTRRALGRYQHDRGLPITCDLDARTIALLRSEP